MPVLRQVHRENFTVLPNELLQDQRLSCRDRGLLVWMLSKPPDWAFSKKSIIAELAMDGESSVQSGVKNLQQAGYLRIDRMRGKKGKLDAVVWTVYDSPQLENTAMDTPQRCFPALDNTAYKKNRGDKSKAAPALEGGAQPGYFFDKTTGTWKRRDVP